MDAGKNSSGKHEYLRSKIQIGNVKGPVSYTAAQTVFHHDDIPETKRLRRNEVKAWAKSKLLSADTPGWDKSAKPNEPVIVRRQAENYSKDRSGAYQYNYRAETLDSLRQVEPIDKPTKFHLSTQPESRALELNTIRATNRIQSGQFTRTREMPVHPDLEDAEPWKLSTEISLREKDQRLADMTQKAQNFTSKVNSLGSTFKKKPYVGPLKAAAELQNEIRRQKAEGTFSLKKQVNSTGLGPVDRTQLKNRVPNEKPNVYLTYTHSGVYETNPTNGRSMWSDTGNERYESRGDIEHRVNLDSLNLAGPNMSQSRMHGGKKNKDKSYVDTASTVSSVY